MPGSIPQYTQNGRYSLSVLWKLKDRLLSTCAAADYTQTYAEDRASSREQARDESATSTRIHIVGIGGVGKLVAHSLKAIPSPPPVTLVLHKPHLVDLWKERGRGIVIENQTSRIGYMQRGYDIELVCRPTHPPSTTAWNGGDSERRRDSPGKGIIRHLIVATSDPATVAAVASVKDRLRSESTVLLLQAGMGLVEEVNEKLFPDRETRPNYMLGITSHKLYPLGGFRAHHTGTGTTALCMLSDGPSTGYWALTSRYLMSTLTRIPVLAAAGFPEAQLKQMKLERLAVDAVVGPLTTLFNCYNGDLLHNFAINNVIRKLVSEISPILLSLPELRGLPNTTKRFSPRRLSKLILVTLATVSRNVSPMLRDVRAGRETGIDYANGYISRRARELGLKCDFNDMVIEMVKGKQQLLSRQRDDYISIE